MKDEYIVASISIPSIVSCYIAYVNICKGDGAIFATVIAGITGIVTLIFKHIYDSKKR